MSKYFIQTTAHKQPKNKLEEAVKEKMVALDATIWPEVDQATLAIHLAYDNAIAGYTGRAKLDFPHTWKEKDKVSFHFGNGIDGSYLNVIAYRVKEENHFPAHNVEASQPGSKAAVYDKIDAILKEAYPEDDENQDENIDLCWIGERVARIFGYL